jgi:glutaredoxin
MEYTRPNESGFTIYSKSGCLQCSKVKTLLQDNKLDFTVVDCDEYILEDKPSFLLFMNSITYRDVKVFPIIFNNGAYIGGYSETKAHVDKQVSFDDSALF